MSENKSENIADTLDQRHWYNKTVKELWNDLKEYVDDLVDLRDGMDQTGTLEYIRNNKKMRGSNAWLLMCSIMVASLGLNLNSPAVIIGAMLISPLMSPILGVGLGFAINDRETLLTSLKHFGASIIIALVTSYLYFKITPISELTNEISSRTAPNLLDGLVAIFGGFAGIISTTRKDKSNAIPGVAIATALMPPLCVAGYGLAEGKFQFFLNAFYLFFLNSFFIALSTYIIIRLLRFRYKQFPNPKEQRRNNIIMIVFSTIMLLPAVWLLIKAYTKAEEKIEIERLLTEHFQDEDTRISNWGINKTDSLTYVDVELIGVPVTKVKADSCEASLAQKLGKNIKVTTYQSREIPFDEIQKLKKQYGDLQGGLASQIDNLRQIQQEREFKIQELTKERDSLQNKVVLPDIFAQAKIIFSDLETIGFSDALQQTTFTKDTSLTAEPIPILLVKWDAKKGRNERKTDQAKLAALLKMQVKLDTLIVVAY